MPSYVDLWRSGELARRAAVSIDLLGERCVVCPRGCKVDRRLDVPGLCAVGRHAVVASHFPHFGEENCLRGRRGSGTIFFSGCNLRCVFCLPPDVKVATTSGPRSIERIFEEGRDEISLDGGVARRLVDVRVFTVSGEPAPAVKAFKHPFRGELVHIKPLSAPELRLTPNHEVFAARRTAPDQILKVPAGELSDDYYLVVPKRVGQPSPVNVDVAGILAELPVAYAQRRGSRIPREQLVEALNSERPSSALSSELGYHPSYVRTLRSRLAHGRLTFNGATPLTLKVEDGLVRFAGEKRPGIPREVVLDSELAWVFGVYCAEGHVWTSHERPNSLRLIFTFGPQEQALTEKAARLLVQKFGVQPQIVHRRTTLAVETGKTSLASLFKCLCGTGAARKQSPQPVFAAPEHAVRGFLRGYLAGDGTVTSTHLVGQTVSAQLASDLYELGLRLAVLPSIHRWVPPPTKIIERRTVSQSPIWYVKFKKDRLDGAVSARERTRWRDAGSHFLVPLHRITREPYEGPVYNLEVDHPSHSYVAPAVAVANCQNHDISWQLRGETTTPARLAEMMLELQAIGCHNVNFVTPEHVVPQILEALPLAVEGGLRLPIVYNTSAYDSLDSLALMEGIVDVYMPDFKLWTNERARRYLKRADYPDVARETIKEMHRQVGDLVLDEQGLVRRGLLLRHLVMPGLVDEAEAILRFVAEELGPDTYVNLMAQYYVSGKVGKDGEYAEIARGVYREEYEQALALADELGLRRLDARSRAERRELAHA